ncbi:hypothetical protein EBU58_02195, partial [bacterium]|nr:hypothetical protein [bacterium]
GVTAVAMLLLVLTGCGDDPDALEEMTPESALGFKADARDYGIGIQLLKDVGLSKVRLLTNNPKKTDAFIYGGFDLKVVDQVPILPPVNEHNQRYLATKREKMGHRFPPPVESQPPMDET